MSRRSRSATASSSGTLILDSEGLSAGARRDLRVLAWLELAAEEDRVVATCATTLVEATNPRVSSGAMEWFASRISVLDVDAAVAQQAPALLRGARLHGHRHAMGALLVVSALTQCEPRTILTSDPDDMRRLAGGSAAVVTLAS